MIFHLNWSNPCSKSVMQAFQKRRLSRRIVPWFTALTWKSFKKIPLPCWSVVVSSKYWLTDYQFIWNTKECCSLFDRNYKKIWRLSPWIIKNSCKNTSKYLKSAYLWIFVGERIRTLHTYRVGMPPTAPSPFPHFRGAVEENCANLFFFFIVPFSKYTRKLWIKETNTHKTVNRWEEAPRQGQTDCACVLDSMCRVVNLLQWRQMW